MKKYKSLISLLLILGMLMSFVTAAPAYASGRITVNGGKVHKITPDAAGNYTVYSNQIILGKETKTFEYIAKVPAKGTYHLTLDAKFGEGRVLEITVASQKFTAINSLAKRTDTYIGRVELEAERAKKERWPIIIPVGTMEYHSTHCPYGCDTLVSLGIANEIAKKLDAVVFPPIWYGVASYAVGGPEKNTIQVDCDTFEQYMYCILKSLFASGFNRNIYILIAHQTEDYLPMTLACMKAAKKLTFEYLDETQGIGWWGNNANRDFYENLSDEDNPWNWVRVIRSNTEAGLPGDHAGEYECSELEYLYPGTIRLDRLKDSEDWFAESAVNASSELGKKHIELTVDSIIKMMKGE